MKKQILTVIFLLISTMLMSQDALTFSYNATESGRNVAFDYSKMFNSKHEIGAGLRININSITQPDDQSNIYYKRLYAIYFYQFFGLHIYYHRMILEKWQCIKPYFFYDLQLTKSTTRSSMFIPYSYDTNGDVLYKNYVEYFGPFLWIDQNIGMGFKAKLFKSLFLFENIGVGMTFILGEDKKLPTTYDKFSRELGCLISVGISYNIAN
jgi:hypothetical protein